MRLTLLFAATLPLPFFGSPALAAATSAQPIGRPAAPAPGSTQRRAILDALRPAVERQVGPNVEFVVREMRVIDGWAFVSATPQRRGGRPINGRRYFQDFEEMGGMEVSAILRLRGGRWTLVNQAIGATDVWYCDMGPPGLTPRCDGN